MVLFPGCLNPAPVRSGSPSPVISPHIPPHCWLDMRSVCGSVHYVAGYLMKVQSVEHGNRFQISDLVDRVNLRLVHGWARLAYCIMLLSALCDHSVWQAQPAAIIGAGCTYSQRHGAETTETNFFHCRTQMKVHKDFELKFLLASPGTIIIVYYESATVQQCSAC